MKRLSFSIAAGLLLLSVPALGQSAPGGTTADARQSEATRTAHDGNGRTGLLSSGFELRAGSDDGEISLTAAREVDNESAFGRTRMAITLTAPFDDDKNRGEFVTRDGVSGDFAGEVSIAHAFSTEGRESDPRAARNLRRIARTNCLKTHADAADITAKCPTTKDFRTWGMDYLSDEQKAAYRQAMGTDDKGFFERDMVFMSATGGISVTDFAVVDPGTLTSEDERKIGYSLASSIGYSRSPRAPFVVASFEHSESWDEEDEEIRCPASTGPTPATCTQGVFSAPSRDIDWKLSGLLRQSFSIGSVPLGIEVKGSYDFEDEILGFELPVYGFLDADRKLRGGVRFEWDDEKKRVAFGIFIGAAFDKFGL